MVHCFIKKVSFATKELIEVLKWKWSVKKDLIQWWIGGPDTIDNGLLRLFSWYSKGPQFLFLFLLVFYTYSFYFCDPRWKSVAVLISAIRNQE